MNKNLQAERLQLLKNFAQAWNDHDIEALMSYMVTDCRFDGSAGPEVFGSRAEGASAVRASYLKMFEVFPDAA